MYLDILYQMYELLFTAASTTTTGQRWSAQNWLRWLLFGDTSDLRGQYFGPIQPGPLTSNEPSAPLAHGKGFLSILFFRIAKAKSYLCNEPESRIIYCKKSPFKIKDQIFY